MRRPAGEPISFPFSYPFWEGFVRTFFSLDKSVLLFDPLLFIVLLIMVQNWSSICRHLRLMLVSTLLLLVAYTAFYARYFDFGGDVAWGHRFVLLPVQLLCLFSVPLLLQNRRPALWVVVFVSLVLQLSSTVISPNVEVIQRQMGYHGGVLWNRAVNIVEISTNREDARFRGIPVESRTLAYFPFQLRFRFPSIAGWAIGAWLILLVSLPVVVCWLLFLARREALDAGPPNPRPTVHLA